MGIDITHFETVNEICKMCKEDPKDPEYCPTTNPFDSCFTEVFNYTKSITDKIKIIDLFTNTFKSGNLTYYQEEEGLYVLCSEHTYKKQLHYMLERL